MKAAFALLLLAGAAHADPKLADEAFARGRKLLAAGNYDWACAAFADSIREDFQYGTLYNLGTCEEKRGHHASALRAFRRLASEDPNAERRTEAAHLVEQIARRVSHLTVTLAERPPGLTITLDGMAVTAQLGGELELDPGQYTIVATAPGRRTWQTTAAIVQEATAVRVTIALDVDTAPGGGARSTLTTEVRPITIAGSGAPRTARALVFGGIGAIVLGGAFFLVSGVDASTKYHCASDRTPDPSCDPTHVHEIVYANDQVRRLNVDGAIVDVVGVLGVAAIVTGIYLWRHSSYELVVTPSPSAPGISLSGSF